MNISLNALIWRLSVFTFGKEIDDGIHNIGELRAKVTIAWIYWRWIGFTLGELLDKISWMEWLTIVHFMTMTIQNTSRGVLSSMSKRALFTPTRKL